MPVFEVYQEPEKKTCKYCGELGDCNGTIDECANCWEVRKRFEQFIKAPENYEWAKTIVDNESLEYEHLTDD